MASCQVLKETNVKRDNITVNEVEWWEDEENMGKRTLIEPS